MEEMITKKLLNSDLGYTKASLIEKIENTYYYDVTHRKYGNYEVQLFSRDNGKTYTIYKESDEGFGDLEGIIDVDAHLGYAFTVLEKELEEIKHQMDICQTDFEFDIIEPDVANKKLKKLNEKLQSVEYAIEKLKS
jgi:hypothetical protein